MTCGFCKVPCNNDWCSTKDNMKNINVNFKKLVPEAVTPKYAKVGDAGMDLTAVSVTETDRYIEYGTGIAIQLSPGFVGLIYPRSSLSNYDLVLSNHVGVIDSGYTGEIKFRFKKTSNGEVGYRGGEAFFDEPKIYKIGDRIGQIIVQEHPLVIFTEVEELEETARGNGGFGSSGK